MTTTKHTPVTDMVRDRKPGHLEAVEVLERSHADLLDTCKRWAVAIGESRAYPDECCSLLRDTRAAIAKAEGGAA